MQLSDDHCFPILEPWELELLFEQEPLPPNQGMNLPAEEEQPTESQYATN